MGVVFDGDLKAPASNPIRTVNFFGKIKQYELMHILEFDSHRKRMSVIVKCLETQRIIVFCKGAEDSVFSKCKFGNIRECDQMISDFARNGWRTLALGLN